MICFSIANTGEANRRPVGVPLADPWRAAHRWSRPLEPHPQLAHPGRAGHLLHVDVGLRADQFTEPRMAVVAGIERRVALAQVGPDLAQVRPAVVLGRTRDRGGQDPLQVGQPRRRLLVLRCRRFRLRRLLTQKIEVDEPVTRRDERRRSVATPEPVDGHPRLPQPRRQPREVAVARDQHEALQVPGVEQVHRIDDQCRIGGVLPARVRELLHRLDRMQQQFFLPADKLLRGPVAIRTLDRRRPVLGDLRQQLGGQAGRRVVRVDEDGEARRVSHEDILAQRGRYPIARTSAQTSVG